MESSFSVLHLVLDSGERLPCLVDATTWIPARVALRWAMRYRRYRVQSSTLAANLRVLAKVYRWTQEIAGFDLDDRLTQGRTLQNREIESLTRSFLCSAAPKSWTQGLSISIWPFSKTF